MKIHSEPFVRKAVLVAASLATFIVCGSAASANPAESGTTAVAAASTDPATPDPDKIVCRSAAPVVGTRLGARRECATQREWDQRRLDSQKELENSQTHTFTQSHGG